MIKNLSISLFMVLTSFQLSLAITLTPENLGALLTSEQPSKMEIEALYLRAKQKTSSDLEKLGLQLNAESKFYKSKEKLLGQFDGGVTRKLNAHTIGISKKTSYGIDFKIEAFGEKITNAFIENASTNGISLGLSMDLIKDFLGRTTRNNLEKNQLSLKRAELEKEIALKAFESNVKKVYWGLVANNEQKKLLISLVKTAEKQLKEAKRRKRSGVADAGEVARYQSQLSSKKTSLHTITYNKTLLNQNLKELFPKLQNETIEIGAYNVNNITKLITICSAVIDQNKTTPFDYTKYDEIIKYLDEEYKKEQLLAKAHNDPSLTLSAEYANVGRDFSYTKARDDFQDHAKARKSLSLNLTIPLDGRKTTTREVLEKLAKSQHYQSTQKKRAMLGGLHSEIKNALSVLKAVIKGQKETNMYLTKSLKVSRKKFSQARISLQELISEEDTFLQSKLNEIESNLTIINALMDYFAVFSETPCQLNKTI